MMELIKKTSRRIVRTRDCSGVCHKCNSPHFYNDEMLLIEIREDEFAWYGVPIDTYECPYCHAPIEVMQIYKSLEVSGELVGNIQKKDEEK